jgi:diacylglycerol kinase family enzyme
VSSVAGAVVGRTDVCLGILPQGTANSIAAHFGISDDLEEACKAIAHGKERVVDSALANDRPMILLATLGVHADAITEAPADRKKRYGALAYVIEEAKKLAGDSRFEVELEAAGERVTVQVSAITVANLAPPTTLFAQGPGTLPDDDGLLDVTLVAIDGIADAVATSLHLASRALRGMPSERDNIGYFRTEWVRIAPREPRRLMVDGEDLGEGAVTVRCIPRSLRVRVPREA